MPCDLDFYLIVMGIFSFEEASLSSLLMEVAISFPLDVESSALASEVGTILSSFLLNVTSSIRYANQLSNSFFS